MLQSSAVHLQEHGGALPTGFLPTPEDLLSSLWSWMHSWELECGSLKRGRMKFPCLSHIQLTNNTILGTSKSPLQHPARAWLRNFPSAWNVDPWASTKSIFWGDDDDDDEAMAATACKCKVTPHWTTICKLEFFTDAITKNIDSATSITRQPWTRNCVLYMHWFSGRLHSDRPKERKTASSSINAILAQVQHENASM